ncbi:unnamed protein product [Vicia faba]|uniref:Uncharacterized protein n=1 Tax=Vicia faba TaxID=3906 RepID=A0AAV1B9U3_VICFA|nr:unnamed protein product [Vicia faba]
MGNGNSRVNTTQEQGESIPNKVRSTIIGRFEDFRKQRNCESTLSKKKLLKNGEEEDDDSSVSRSSVNETNETKDGKVSISTKEKTTVPLTTTENISRVVPVENIKCKTTEEKVNIKNEIDVSKDKDIRANVKDEEEIKRKEESIKRLVEEVEKEQEQEASAKCEMSDDNDHEDDDDERELGRFLCPRSPSFRIYCIEADERKTQEKEEKEDEEEKFKSPTLQKSRSDNCLESSSSKKTRISNEVSEVVENAPSTKRKGHMMRRFGAVRTLLKVKSCYHPICTCTGDDRRSKLVYAKATN